MKAEAATRSPLGSRRSSPQTLRKPIQCLELSQIQATWEHDKTEGVQQLCAASHCNTEDTP